nr:Chain B, cp3 peptide [synthetic construct]
PIRYPWDVEC